MDRILVISREKELSHRIRGMLQQAGFFVVLSSSLEESFLEMMPAEAFLVLVDRDALPERLWEAERYLRWFHHRSPVWLLASGECPELQEEYDRYLPKTVDRKTLLAHIRHLRPRARLDAPP